MTTVAKPTGTAEVYARAESGVQETLEHGRILLHLLTYVRPYRLRFGLMMCCIFLATATKIGGLVLIKPFGDLILGTFDPDAYASVPGLDTTVGRYVLQGFADTLQQSPYAALVLLVQLLFLLVVVQTFSHLGAVYLQSHIGGCISVDLKQKMLSRLLVQPLDYYQQMGKGVIHQIIDQDSAAAFRTLYVVFNRLVRGPVEAVTVLAIALTIDWKLTLFAGALLPIVLGTVTLFRRRLQHQDANMMQLLGAGSNVLQEVLAAPEVVKAYQMEPYFENRYGRLSRKLFRALMSLRKSKEWMGPIMDLSAGAAIAVFVYANGRALMAGGIDLPSFMLLYACLASLIDPIRKLGKGYAEIYLNFMSLRRVFDMLSRTPEIPDGAVTVDDIDGAIEFRHVSFAYLPGQPVLRDVSFRVEPGERVALVGPSGAGKTTLVRLLLRLYEPQGGSIRLDGYEVRDLTQRCLRTHVGLVTQQAVLFTGTVRENIAAGRPDADGVGVMRAARIAQAHDFIMQLPQQYDTPLGDHGSDVSGGQAQRIALARAVFREPRVLVLDEAMSSLDSMAEEAICQGLLGLTVDRTSLIIAHRLSTITAADRVILLHEGRVAAQGTHAALLTEHALYRDLFERQLLPILDDVAATGDATVRTSRVGA